MSSEESSDIEIESGESDYNSEDSCEEYTLIPEKSMFNKSMGDISSNWTPLKYRLGSNFDFCNKKTKQRIVKKAMKAIDNFLENIAPGQVEKLKVECFQQDKEEKEENELLSCLCKAISEAPGRNTRIQLLSVVCKKGSDGKYLYSQDELLDKFKGITLCDVKQTRKHASNDKVGMPIRPGHYSRKKLSDAQINHFLDFLQYGGVMQDVAVELDL